MLSSADVLLLEEIRGEASIGGTPPDDTSSTGLPTPSRLAISVLVGCLLGLFVVPPFGALLGAMLGALRYAVRNAVCAAICPGCLQHQPARFTLIGAVLGLFVVPPFGVLLGVMVGWCIGMIKEEIEAMATKEEERTPLLAVVVVDESRPQAETSAYVV